MSTRLSTDRLIYNTRASRPLEEFLVAVRRRWLAEPRRLNSSSPKIFGPELDIKFRNLLHDALNRNEFVLSGYFVAPSKREDRFLLFRRVKWRPGHLFALTSGNRLLWLKDEYRGHWERYAGVTISAPLPLLQRSKVKNISAQDELVIDFASGFSWRITIRETNAACIEFSRVLNGYAAHPDTDISRFLLAGGPDRPKADRTQFPRL
jgi:hypothetical protein